MDGSSTRKHNVIYGMERDLIICQKNDRLHAFISTVGLNSTSREFGTGHQTCHSVRKPRSNRPLSSARNTLWFGRRPSSSSSISSSSIDLKPWCVTEQFTPSSSWNERNESTNSGDIQRVFARVERSSIAEESNGNRKILKALILPKWGHAKTNHPTSRRIFYPR